MQTAVKWGMAAAAEGMIVQHCRPGPDCLPCHDTTSAQVSLSEYRHLARSGGKVGAARRCVIRLIGGILVQQAAVSIHLHTRHLSDAEHPWLVRMKAGVVLRERVGG